MFLRGFCAALLRRNAALIYEFVRRLRCSCHIPSIIRSAANPISRPTAADSWPVPGKLRGGVAVGAGIAGAVVGALSGSFASEDTKAEIVNRYGMALREGQAIVCVTARDTETAKAAEQMLNDAGASNVNSYLADSQS